MKISKIYKENLLSALLMAIDNQREYERVELNYQMDSGLVAGWVELVNNLKENNKNTIIIKE